MIPITNFLLLGHVFCGFCHAGSHIYVGLYIYIYNFSGGGREWAHHVPRIDISGLEPVLRWSSDVDQSLVVCFVKVPEAPALA